MTSSLLDPRALTTTPGEAIEPDEVYKAFTDWVTATGIRLYPAQDEAIIEIVSAPRQAQANHLSRLARTTPPWSQASAASTPRRSRRS
jgi:hypothetical protein